MKKQFVYIGSIIILVISVLTFVVFGVGTEVFTALFGKQNQLPPFGKYDGKKIEYVAGSEFANLTSRFAENYKAQGYELNSQSEYYIFSQAFTQTIMNMAFNDAVKKSGYEVPESAVNRQMLPYFYDETGKYSPRLYNSIDDATKNKMRDSIKDELYYARYTDDLLGSINKLKDSSLYGLKSTAKEKDFLSDMGKTKRSFNMASFSTADFPKDEAKKFAESHKELFVKYDISAQSHVYGYKEWLVFASFLLVLFELIIHLFERLLLQLHLLYKHQLVLQIMLHYIQQYLLLKCFHLQLLVLLAA